MFCIQKINMCVIGIPIVLLGSFIGSRLRLIQKVELLKWRKEIFNLKKQSENFLQMFGNTGMKEDINKRIKYREEQREQLQSFITSCNNLEELGKSVGAEDFEFHEYVLSLKEELQNLESSEIVDNEFLDHWGDVKRRWNPKIKRREKDIKKYEMRIAVFDELIAGLTN